MKWRICDVDATSGRTIRQGEGLNLLMVAFEDIVAREAEHTADGMVTSGNIAVYWWKE